MQKTTDHRPQTIDHRIMKLEVAYLFVVAYVDDSSSLTS